MTQWMEEEIDVPTGRKQGKYRHATHPVSRFLFAEFDSGRWWRFAVVAPTQNGKSLMGYVGPVLYHAFELCETVVVGVFDMRMANDKWEKDFLPIIEKNPRLKAMLPPDGEGSRGGKLKSGVTFTNGGGIRFMTAGGDEKSRASFTARVAAITETDGMDDPGESSREADKCTQIEGRLRGYLEHERRTYLECTASTPEGKIWSEFSAGSQSRFARPCPYCGVWVTPERENLKGWQDAIDEEEAREKSAWHCPECDHAWTQADREWGWARMKLIHRGQDVTLEGEITGKQPRTRTLGFRWGAIDNPFTTAGTCGAEEWRVAHLPDSKRAEAERAILQFTNAKPWVDASLTLDELDPVEIASRALPLKRNMVPDGTIGISVGVDTHSKNVYYVVLAIVACQDRYRLHVVDHARVDLDIAHRAARDRILRGIVSLKQKFDGGWFDKSGNKFVVSQVWIDSGYPLHTMPIYAACSLLAKGRNVFAVRWRATKGHSATRKRMGSKYTAPTSTVGTCFFLGNDYHIVYLKTGKDEFRGAQLVHVNHDTYLTLVHEGLRIGEQEQFTKDAPELPVGAITLFDPENGEDRNDFAVHCCNLKLVQEKTRSGVVNVWRDVGPVHYADALYLAVGAAEETWTHRQQLCGVSSVRPAVQPAASGAAQQQGVPEANPGRMRARDMMAANSKGRS